VINRLGQAPAATVPAESVAPFAPTPPAPAHPISAPRSVAQAYPRPARLVLASTGTDSRPLSARLPREWPLVLDLAQREPGRVIGKGSSACSITALAGSNDGVLLRYPTFTPLEMLTPPGVRDHVSEQAP